MTRQWGPWQPMVSQRPRDPGYRGAWLLGSEGNAEHGGLTAGGQPHPLAWITCSVLVNIIIC